MNAVAYAGPSLEGFNAGDTVDIKNFSAAGSALSYDGSTGVMQLSNSAAQAASLHFLSSSVGGGTFQVAGDGANGVLIRNA